MAGEVGVEQRALEGRHVGVLEGWRVGDGQVVGELVPGLLDDVHHLEYDRVGVFLLEQGGGVDDEVVALTVGHQHAAVAVEDVPSRGRDGLVRIAAVGALVGVGRAVEDLHLVERADAKRHEQRDYEAEGHDSRGFDFTSHVVFPFSVGMRLHYHTYIFFLPIALQGK